MNTSIGYVTRWLETVEATLKKDPNNVLHHYTHPPYSGSSGWNSMIDQVYFRPSNGEEYTLRGKVHEVLVTAYRNVVAKANELPQKKWSAWGCMDVTEAYRLALMIGQVDPIKAVMMKVEINNLCQKFGETLFRINTGEATTALCYPSEEEMVW